MHPKVTLKEHVQFAHHLHVETGLSIADDCSDIAAAFEHLSRIIHEGNERACSDPHFAEVCKIASGDAETCNCRYCGAEADAYALAARHSLSLHIGGDPRGLPLKFTFKTGATNSWGGTWDV